MVSVTMVWVLALCSTTPVPLINSNVVGMMPSLTQSKAGTVLRDLVCGGAHRLKQEGAHILKVGKSNTLKTTGDILSFEVVSDTTNLTHIASQQGVLSTKLTQQSVA